MGRQCTVAPVRVKARQRIGAAWTDKTVNFRKKLFADY